MSAYGLRPNPTHACKCVGDAAPTYGVWAIGYSVGRPGAADV